jgi:hypothetical protein
MIVGPHATESDETGTWIIAGDADWRTPGLHNTYRDAIRVALTQHPRSWVELEPEGFDDDPEFGNDGFSPDEDRQRFRSQLVAIDFDSGFCGGATISTELADGSGVETFRVRNEDIDPLRDRMTDVSSALRGLAAGSAHERPGEGDGGDIIRDDIGDVIPRAGTIPPHLS